MGKGCKMLVSIVTCTLYVLFAVAGMAFIKSGHTTESICTIPVLDVSVSMQTLLGILLYGLSFVLFVFYVSKLNIGIIVPVLSGLTCIATVAVGYMIFKENITPGQFVGIAIIIIGTVLVGVFR